MNINDSKFESKETQNEKYISSTEIKGSKNFEDLQSNKKITICSYFENRV